MTKSEVSAAIEVGRTLAKQGPAAEARELIAVGEMGYREHHRRHGNYRGLVRKAKSRR